MKFTIIAVATATGLAFSSAAAAQAMSKEQYKSGKAGIAAEYRAAKAACAPLSGNGKDQCTADARGKEKVAKAELLAKYQPSEEASYKVRVAKADADQSVARGKCDEKAGNDKDVCVRQVKAAAVAAKAQARARLKNEKANANENAPEPFAEAKDKADEKAARKE
jgi:hypothetical protein